MIDLMLAMRLHSTRRLCAVAAIAVALSSCTTFEVVEGGPRTVHLVTRAQGDVSAAYASGDTTIRAARLTLERGFSHFKVSNIHYDRQGSSTLSLRTTVEMSDRRENASYNAAREVLAR